MSPGMIERLLTDPRGYAWAAFRARRMAGLRVTSTIACRILLGLRGVELGGRCSFFGVPVVCRHPRSSIRIGSRSVLRSDRTSNLAGVNRRCILATFSEQSLLQIGDGSGLSGTVIGALGSVVLGQGVLCGANTFITDFDWHSADPLARRSVLPKPQPVFIASNVWLGLGSIVLKGVSIGENSVIGAGSVVSHSIPANVIAAGNPCTVLRNL